MSNQLLALVLQRRWATSVIMRRHRAALSEALRRYRPQCL